VRQQVERLLEPASLAGIALLRGLQERISDGRENDPADAVAYASHPPGPLRVCPVVEAFEERAARRLVQLDQSGPGKDGSGSEQCRLSARHVERGSRTVLGSIAGDMATEDEGRRLVCEAEIDCSAERRRDPPAPSLGMVPPAVHSQCRVGHSPKSVARHPAGDDDEQQSAEAVVEIFERSGQVLGPAR
jgi:hypothetical protein